MPEVGRIWPPLLDDPAGASSASPKTLVAPDMPQL